MTTEARSGNAVKKSGKAAVVIIFTAAFILGARGNAAQGKHVKYSPEKGAAGSIKLISAGVAGNKNVKAAPSLTPSVAIATGTVHTATGVAHPNIGPLVPPMLPPKILQKAKEDSYKSVNSIRKQHKSEIEMGNHFRKFMHGDESRKEIAITIDDGPHPKYTPQLLDILKKYNVKVTFFVVGEMAEKYPDLVRMEVADGHEIGNHTYHHVNLKKIPEGYISDEIKECDVVIKHITGKSTRLFRPPGGFYNKSIADVSGELGYTLILWTDDPGDYASPGKNVIYNRLIRKADNGGIILIHDGVQQTVDILPSVIEKLRSQGYEIVPLEEMMHQKVSRR